MAISKNAMIAIIVVAAIAVAAIAFVAFSNGGGSDEGGNGARVGEVIEEKDFPNSESRLWVYGNANEDDYMNEDDLTALKAMVSGSAKHSQLADANADGTIDSNDVDYLKKILDAKESTKLDVYYIDNYFTVAKVSWPVKSFATSYCSGLYTAEATGLTQKMTMVDQTISDYWASLNSYAEKATVFGETEGPNYDLMMKNKIDVYVPGYCDAKADPLSKEKLNPVGIDVMFMNTCDNSGVDYPNEYIDRSILMFGYLLQGDVEQCYLYLAWHDKIKDAVTSAASTLDESEKGALIMSRSAPTYSESPFSLTGKGNTNMIHADWAGCYVVADHSSWLNKNYQDVRTEDILKILRETAESGHQTVYWIDNEHDGLRHQKDRDLDETLPAWAKELSVAVSDNYYLGMAREAGNSPLYVIEMVFYMNVMHPGLIDLKFDEEFNYFIENFTLETNKYTSKMDIDDFFKEFGFL